MQQLPVDLKTHSSVLLADKVRQICAPFFEHFDLNLFYFIKSYYNGTKKGKRILLSSDANWVHDYFQAKHYEYELVSYPKVLQDKIFVASIWEGCNSHHDSCKMGLLTQKKYHVSHLFYLTWVYDDYIEVYVFGVKQGQDHVAQQLLFNMDLFQHFCHYFNDVGQNLLKQASKDAFQIPISDSKNYSNPHYLDVTLAQKQALLQKMAIDKVYLKGKYQNVYLTIDEAKTIALACQTLQYAEIAKILSVSVHTIKYRINSIRKKCHAKNKQALIQLFIEEDFVTLLKQALR